MDYIEWNYIQAKRQANKLEEQAERLNQIARCRMADSLQKLSHDWTGESAGAYLAKGERIRSETERLAGELQRTAAVIRSLAERTYRAEVRVRELARQRKYR